MIELEARQRIEYQPIRIIGRSYLRSTDSGNRIAVRRLGADDISRGSTTTEEGANTSVEIYVPLSPIDRQPFVIGTGGFATVFLAFESPATNGQPLAIKLLKREQGTGTPNGRYRFIEEIHYNQLLSKSPHGTFVVYRGFGYLGGEPGTSTDPNVEKKEGRWVLEDIDPDDIRAIRVANRDTKLDEKFLSDHQDLFFVMDAAWCSLEQLLVSSQPLHQSNTLSLSFPANGSADQFAEKRDGPEIDEPQSIVLNTAYGAAFENLRRNTDVVNQVQRISETLNISDSSSGLQILSAIRQRVSDAVATKIILDTLVRLSHAVGTIHQFAGVGANGRPETLHLAHRDLKPANFLIQDGTGLSPDIVLSDLGFIAKRQGDATMYGGFGPVRDPGALPVGSVMYQAPEQMLSGREISFELVTVAAYRKRLVERGTNQELRPIRLSGTEYVANAIRIRTVGGIQIEPKDRILSTEIALMDGGDGGRMEIRSIDSDPMYPTNTVGFLEQLIAVGQTPRAEYKGLLVKPVGQHSDLFSLGCHAYLMASGGKDPGEFYRTYLRPPSGLVHLDASAPRTDCLAIARYLAKRNGSIAESREVSALLEALKGASTMAVMMSHFAKVGRFRASATRDYLLFTTDEHPIGIILLYVIVSLMCRDIAGAYVNGDASARETTLDDSATRLEGFLNKALIGLRHQYASVMNDDPLGAISQEGLTALLKVRLLSPARN